MLPKKTEGKTILVCNSCGHTEKATWVSDYKLKEKAKQREEVPVVEESESTLPTAKVKCPKCGNNKAYWWMRQTRSADEPTTRFYKCTKCKHVWREYT